MDQVTLPCIVCNKPLVSAFADDNTAPMEGVRFTSPGNYGSQVFDSMYKFLEINVCDTCIESARARGAVLYSQVHTSYRKTSAVWAGETE